MPMQDWIDTYPLVKALLQRDDDEILYTPRDLTGREESERPQDAPPVYDAGDAA